MALHTASYASSAVAPAATATHTFPQQGLSEDSLPGTSSAQLTRGQTMSSRLPPACSNPMQSFPMVSPALSVMVPASVAGQGFHSSPMASQVCSLSAIASCHTCLHLRTECIACCRQILLQCAWYKTLLFNKLYRRVMSRLQLKLL